MRRLGYVAAVAASVSCGQLMWNHDVIQVVVAYHKSCAEEAITDVYEEFPPNHRDIRVVTSVLGDDAYRDWVTTGRVPDHLKRARVIVVADSSRDLTSSGIVLSSDVPQLCHANGEACVGGIPKWVDPPERIAAMPVLESLAAAMVKRNCLPGSN